MPEKQYFVTCLIKGTKYFLKWRWRGFREAGGEERVGVCPPPTQQWQWPVWWDCSGPLESLEDLQLPGECLDGKLSSILVNFSAVSQGAGLPVLRLLTLRQPAKCAPRAAYLCPVAGLGGTKLPVLQIPASAVTRIATSGRGGTTWRWALLAVPPLLLRAPALLLKWLPENLEGWYWFFPLLHFFLFPFGHRH